MHEKVGNMDFLVFFVYQKTINPISLCNGKHTSVLKDRSAHKRIFFSIGATGKILFHAAPPLTPRKLIEITFFHWQQNYLKNSFSFVHRSEVNKAPALSVFVNGASNRNELENQNPIDKSSL